MKLCMHAETHLIVMYVIIQQELWEFLEKRKKLVAAQERQMVIRLLPDVNISQLQTVEMYQVHLLVLQTDINNNVTFLDVFPTFLVMS